MVTKRHATRIRAPAHRHAAPCGPWPWINLDDDASTLLQTSADPHQSPHLAGERKESCQWAGYPQSLFPNWTPRQVDRSRMKSLPGTTENCVIHRVEVTNDGTFYIPASQRAKGDDEFWKLLQESVSHLLPIT